MISYTKWLILTSFFAMQTSVIVTDYKSVLSIGFFKHYDFFLDEVVVATQDEMKSAIQNCLKNSDYSIEYKKEWIAGLKKALEQRIEKIQLQIENNFTYDQESLLALKGCTVLLIIFGVYCKYLYNQKIDYKKNLLSILEECNKRHINVCDCWNNDLYLTRLPNNNDSYEQFVDLYKRYEKIHSNQNIMSYLIPAGYITYFLGFFELLIFYDVCTQNPNQYNQYLSRYEDLLSYLEHIEKNMRTFYY